MNLLESRPFRVGLWILLILLILLVGKQVSFLFWPLAVIAQTLFLPLLFSGILYYLARPLVGRLHEKKLPRPLAILVVYLILGGVLAIFLLIAVPVLQREVNRLIDEAPVLFEEMRRLLLELQELELFQRLEAEGFENLAERFSGTAEQLFSITYANITAFLQFIGNILLAFVTVPFILYYLLKDDYKIPEAFLKYAPRDQVDDLRKVLGNIDWAISSYIQGQALVCISVGTLAFIGYTIIGLDYALILALFAMITNVIPYFGPVIGAVPALVVGLLQEPLMALLVLVVILVVQQLESLVIAPQVMGRKLHISPVIVILLILVAGRLAGLLGMVLAVPTFAVVRILFGHLYDLIKQYRESKKEPAP